MTLLELNAKVRDWDLQNTSGQIATSKYTAILSQLYRHAEREWRVYLPAEHPEFDPDYLERLAAWIGNLPDEADQKLLLEYALCISFFSHDDFVALYRTALNRDITRWIATQIGATLNQSGGQAFHNLIHHEIHHHTWFCPVTDSMDINEFYKVNHLKGVGHRPGFSTLQMLAEEAGILNPELATNVKHYMLRGNTFPLKRLVLLEDIVGSATQCLNAVEWACNNLGVPVLFVPLILCPNGVIALQALAQQSNGGLSVRPVVELRRGDLLGPERQGNTGWPITVELEDLALRSANQVGVTPHQAFGYNQTGCSLATFANTPDNSLPLIHRKASNGSWNPLFPRIYRG